GLESFLQFSEFISFARPLAGLRNALLFYLLLLNFHFINNFFKLTILSLLLLPLPFMFSDLPFMTESLTLASIDKTSAVVASSMSTIACADCDYIVPAGQTRVDGAALGLKPGDVIGLSADIAYRNLNFQNIVGTADQPIIIKNCGGIARLE